MKGIRPPKSEDNFVDRLKMASYKKGMSLKQLADEVGVNYTTLLIQRNKVTLCAHNLMNICTRLECSADYLLFGKKR